MSSMPSAAQDARSGARSPAMRFSARLRSSSWTSGLMPIFFHCSRTISAICVNGTNCAAHASCISMRSAALAVGCAGGTPRRPSCRARSCRASRSPSSGRRSTRACGTRARGCTCWRLAGDDEPGVPDAEPERLVDLVAVDAERQRAPEVGVVEPLRDLRVGLVAQVELERAVAAVVAGVEVDLVVALLLVLEEDRQLAEVDVPLLEVVLAGDGAQVEDLQVLGQRAAGPCRCTGAGCPSVSTQMLYGLRSSVQVGVLIGRDGLPGRDAPAGPG